MCTHTPGHPFASSVLVMESSNPESRTIVELDYLSGTSIITLVSIINSYNLMMNIKKDFREK